MIFSELIKNEYHSQCWKESIEAILKKSNKNDYSQSKSYRIIMLLNCLRKISEKIIATRLSHFAEHSNLLHNEQMKDRKNRFAIDASLCLLHDIQIAKNSKNVFSCLFLDVKEAFNHVSTERLIAILYKLKMSDQLIRWVRSFMSDRKIELAFDEKKQTARAISIEISQESLISSILFSIYIRFLFSKIRNEVKDANIKMSNFIDDVTIEIESKSAKQNCKVLTEIVQKVFQWADQNAVKFDDEKSKLIHFQLLNKSRVTVWNEMKWVFLLFQKEMK